MNLFWFHFCCLYCPACVFCMKSLFASLLRWIFLIRYLKFVSLLYFIFRLKEKTAKVFYLWKKKKTITELSSRNLRTTFEAFHRVEGGNPRDLLLRPPHKEVRQRKKVWDREIKDALPMRVWHTLCASVFLLLCFFLLIKPEIYSKLRVWTVFNLCQYKYQCSIPIQSIINCSFE